MVGTPAAMVTRSLSMRSASGFGAMPGPGITRLAPVATATWARPHALAWNMGTTGRMVSVSEAPMASLAMTPMVCR